MSNWAPSEAPAQLFGHGTTTPILTQDPAHRDIRHHAGRKACGSDLIKGGQDLAVLLRSIPPHVLASGHGGTQT